jgi:hypothetical protein
MGKMKDFYHFAFTILEAFAREKLRRAVRRVEDLSAIVDNISDIHQAVLFIPCPVCAARRENEEDQAVH